MQQEKKKKIHRVLTKNMISFQESSTSLVVSSNFYDANTASVWHGRLCHPSPSIFKSNLKSVKSLFHLQTRSIYVAMPIPCFPLV